MKRRRTVETVHLDVNNCSSVDLSIPTFDLIDAHS